MNGFTKNVALLALGATLSWAPGAHATDAAPTGQLCGFTSALDPGVEGAHTGWLYGGGLLLIDPSSGTVFTGTLTCTIQTGTNDTYVEADAASATGVNGTVVTAGEVVTYEVPETDAAYVCTTVTLDMGIELYYDYATLAWSHDPTSTCGLAVSGINGSPRWAVPLVV